MRHVIRVLIAVLALAFGPTSLAKTPKGILDGKKFPGLLTDLKTSETSRHTLIFENGAIYRKAEGTNGPVLYTTSQKGGVTTFAASATSHRGKVEWIGTVENNKVEARVVKEALDGSQQIFLFKGELAKEEVKKGAVKKDTAKKGEVKK